MSISQTYKIQYLELTANAEKEILTNKMKFLAIVTIASAAISAAVARPVYLNLTGISDSLFYLCQAQYQIYLRYSNAQVRSCLG